MLKRITIVAFLLFVAFDVSSTVQAAEPARIASLEISVWPEYDQPGVLVQYQGDLVDSKAGDSQELSFLVPKGAGVGAACGIKADGNHTSETWKEADAGEGFTALTYKLTDRKFHVEFYYNPIIGTTDKSMEYLYKAASPVDDLYIDIQHPLKATNFVLSPEAGESRTDKDGFTYHVYNLKQVASGQTVSSKVSYTKTDPGPSVSGQKPVSSPATTQAANQGLDTNSILMISILAAAVMLIGYFAFFRRSQPQLAAIPGVAFEDGPRVSSGGFCTTCGSPLAPEDRFCGSCGMKKRTLEANPG